LRGPAAQTERERRDREGETRIQDEATHGHCDLPLRHRERGNPGGCDRSFPGFGSTPPRCPDRFRRADELNAWLSVNCERVGNLAAGAEGCQPTFAYGCRNWCFWIGLNAEDDARIIAPTRTGRHDAKPRYIETIPGGSGALVGFRACLRTRTGSSLFVQGLEQHERDRPCARCATSPVRSGHQPDYVRVFDSVSDDDTWRRICPSVLSHRWPDPAGGPV
jgi:hypothetical protein